MAKKQAKQTKKRKVRVEAMGEAHIGSSFNNIIISLTNQQGQVISWSSAGKMGFRQKKTLLMLPKWLLRIAEELHWKRA